MASPGFVGEPGYRRGMVPVVYIVCMFFFFSSRRRHTRFDCDWSSDVCSSDLAAAARHALAPELVEAVIRVESNFEPRAVSSKGARGLMQLMPKTARLLGVRNVFDARQNIEGGARHLRNLVDLYNGNLTLALAAYNAGADAVARHGGIPPYAETRAYVARVLKLLQRTGLPASAG